MEDFLEQLELWTAVCAHSEFHSGHCDVCQVVGLAKKALSSLKAELSSPRTGTLNLNSSGTASFSVEGGRITTGEELLARARAANDRPKKRLKKQLSGRVCVHSGRGVVEVDALA